LIERFVELCDHTKTGIILDFFAGSGTTAEAVMKANAEGARRKFIVVQVAEKIALNDKSNSKIIEYLNQKELLTNLAEISKERIRRAGAKILEGECHQDWNKDIGFRVLKVDTSNMKDVYYRPDEVDQSTACLRLITSRPTALAKICCFRCLSIGVLI
jgi:adenine-specific DNA-methyltransferase